MSLRSGSPCTSTSRPMSSWRRITRSISPRIRLEVLLLVDLALAQLASAPGGSRPSAGTSRSSWSGTAAARAARAGPRGARGTRCRDSASASVTCSSRSRTCGFAGARRVARGPRAPGGSPRAPRRSRRAPSFTPAASTATSSSFCTANDIQLRTSSSRRGSLRLSIGECCSEQDVETTTLSPACPRSSSSRSRLRARSLIHTLRPVHDAREQGLVLGPPVLGDQLAVLRRRRRSRATRRRPAGARAPGSLADVVEVGRDQDLRSALDRREPLVGALERLELRGRAVLDQHGLVELHPLGAEPAELGQHLGVHLHEVVEQLQPVELLTGALALQQEGQRPDQHRLGLDAEVLGLLVVLERLARGEAGTPCRAELGDDVVVVGVEPLRHLHRGHVDAAGLAAARHREVGVEVDVARAVPAVALRHCADQCDRVQHLVVEREVVGRDQVDPGVALELPVGRAQLTAVVPGRPSCARPPSTPRSRT